MNYLRAIFLMIGVGWISLVAFPMFADESTPAPFIEVGSKVVIVSKQLVFESREALHKARAILQSGKPDAEIDRVINRMIKNGECSQLQQFMRATVIVIDGDDVQIQQREGSYGAKWWIERSVAQ